MKKINIVAVGKVKEKYFASGIAEYLKRLTKFTAVSITEIKEYNFSGGQINKTLSGEAADILKNLKGYVIALAIEGKTLGSEELAKKLDTLSVGGVSEITFVIGGSNGLSDEVKKRADFLLSFGDMTFPHTLMRLMLTEQIYRSFTILNNISYHK